MSGHQNIRFYSQNAPGADHKPVSADGSIRSVRCPHPDCGREVGAAVIAMTRPDVAVVGRPSAPPVEWLRCPSCDRGMVFNAYKLEPAATVGEAVDGLPADTQSAFGEARAAMSAGAFTAGELMCRKILMHVAVDKGADENKTESPRVS